jgi:hypothetical protein
MHKLALTLALTIAFAGTSAIAQDDISKVNSGIRVETGQTAGDLDTVNGGIRVGDDAVIGDAETVNGGIRLGRGVRAESAETVNGGIDIDERSTVSGDVGTVNGGIETRVGVEIGGGVETVNGGISLIGTRVERLVETVNGDITVTDGSRVGGIRVEKPGGWSWGKPKVPRIVIGPQAVVDGPMEFEREVELWVHASARIGDVRGASVQRYEDALPPR